MLGAPRSLQPFVEHFWTQRKVPASAEQLWRIPPDANPYLIFTASSSTSGEPRVRCMLVGPCSRFLDIPVGNRVYTCGVRLRPGVLRLLARLPVFELTNEALPIEEVFAARGLRLLDQLGEPASWDQAPARMAEFLRRELAKHDSFRPLPIRRTRSVDALAEEVGCATRTLHYRVVQEVGFSPKLWLRIERLHRAIASSIARVGPWAEIATNCGFADQAHMVREFKALLGESPTAWSRRSPFVPLAEAAGAG